MLAAGAAGTLWISLILCFSFATYGLLRKVIAVDSLAGLSIETALLFPIALGWLLLGGATGSPMFDHSGTINSYLIAAGVVSTVPLAYASPPPRADCPTRPSGCCSSSPRRCNSCSRCGVWRALSTAHAIAFAAIWVALALYVSSLLSDRRASKARATAELGEA